MVLAYELKIFDSSIRRILENELQNAHDLTAKKQQVRLKRAKELLRFAETGQFPNFVSHFLNEQFANSQNDKVYLTELSHENFSLSAIVFIESCGWFEVVGRQKRRFELPFDTENGSRIHQTQIQ